MGGGMGGLCFWDWPGRAGADSGVGTMKSPGDSFGVLGME